MNRILRRVLRAAPLMLNDQSKILTSTKKLTTSKADPLVIQTTNKFEKCLFKHETTQHETGNFRRGRMNAWRSPVNQQMSS